MSSTQHKAIDLIGKVSVLQRFKRARDQGPSRKETEKAIDALLSRQVKSAKMEAKPESQTKSEPSGLHVPEVEWWDACVVDDPQSVSHLVEHPVPLQGLKASSKSNVPLVKAYLTEKEREKLRRLKKKEKEQDIQDKIRMGLLKPPPPRIKLKNLMRIVGEEAVAGPSAIEQAARAQAEERVREHEQRNLDRKLTPEQRRAKNITKWTKPIDYSNILKTSVYAVFTEISGKARFKICINADQLHLSGIFVDSKSNEQPSLVVVEGSRKGVKRFDRLMLHRINWTSNNNDEEMKEEEEDDDGDSQDDTETLKQSGKCVRIFHGSEAKPESKKYIPKWTYVEMKDDYTSIVQQKGYMHYWEMLSRYRSASLDI
jgi:U4/U6 small nuclear ribonucleoprotein PRP3